MTTYTIQELTELAYRFTKEKNMAHDSVGALSVNFFIVRLAQRQKEEQDGKR